MIYIEIVRKTERNYVFMDMQNMYLSICALGWKIDWGRFRTYLREKYAAEKVFVFIGYIPTNHQLYETLAVHDFECIFKRIVINKNGFIKGNVDTELVLHTMMKKDEFDSAVIISGDGDFECPVTYLLSIHKLKTVLIPNRYQYSILLRKAAGKHIAFMNDLRHRIAQK